MPGDNTDQSVVLVDDRDAHSMLVDEEYSLDDGCVGVHHG